MEELDLKELFLIFWNRKLEILLITIIALIVGVLYSYFYLTPVYKASTTLILAQSSNTVDKTGDTSITQTDLTLNSKLVSTYSEIMKRKSVLSKVISNLGMSEEYMDSIKENLSVKAVSDTELIEITVKNEDPEKAALIANEIAKVFSEKVVEIYNISNIYVLDRAEANPVPCNINHAKDLVIFAFIGLVISVIVCLIANMLDTTIKTEEDVEKATGLMVLTSIPDYNIENSRKGGRR
ncbi:MAG: YveK family protein [Clostridia bacterium]